ncbi:MAG: hypothetical protein JNL88_00170 [Bacteroidia bacterium]|nr:hypothetical protein [Bacteroidia bacterium]
MYPINYTGQILQRYALPSTYSVMKDQRGFNDLVYELAQAFEWPWHFNEKAFMHFPAELITDYIRRTHRLYLFRKLPEIEQSIGLLLQDYTDDHPILSILRDFYTSYKVELSLHICEEEQHLLPYVDFLVETQQKGLDPYRFLLQRKRYSLAEFEQDHHDDHEKSLEEIRETILLHEPPVTNATPYRILLRQLENFERDLTVHGLIEDRVLLPRMKMLEEKLQRDFEQIVKNN